MAEVTDVLRPAVALDTLAEMLRGYDGDCSPPFGESVSYLIHACTSDIVRVVDEVMEPGPEVVRELEKIRAAERRG
ncbi:MAG: hypothetical protein SWQ30_10070 [Thermodesulfobacteriota bacterium]|nr:hypothetical protein [Thermodesulfobacteriota bacterium]